MNIMQKIEQLRSELIKQGKLKGIRDPQVIQLSQRLDKLIIIYYLE